MNWLRKSKPPSAAEVASAEAMLAQNARVEAENVAVEIRAAELRAEHYRVLAGMSPELRVLLVEIRTKSDPQALWCDYSTEARAQIRREAVTAKDPA